MCTGSLSTCMYSCGGFLKYCDMKNCCVYSPGLYFMIIGLTIFAVGVAITIVCAVKRAKMIRAAFGVAQATPMIYGQQQMPYGVSYGVQLQPQVQVQVQPQQMQMQAPPPPPPQEIRYQPQSTSVMAPPDVQDHRYTNDMQAMPENGAQIRGGVYF